MPAIVPAESRGPEECDDDDDPPQESPLTPPPPLDPPLFRFVGAVHEIWMPVLAGSLVATA